MPQGSQKFEFHKKTLFLLGGSQGSLQLNQWLKSFITRNRNFHEKLQIIHQTGHQTSFDWHSFYAQHNVPAFVFPFQKDVKPLYQLADLIMCRAGAGTLFEVKFFEKQCIVIPLVASTTSHQVDNARAMADMHPEFFTVLSQNDLKDKPSKLDSLVLKHLGLTNPKCEASNNQNYVDSENNFCMY